jgi:hypothetical protein
VTLFLSHYDVVEVLNATRIPYRSTIVECVTVLQTVPAKKPFRFKSFKGSYAFYRKLHSDTARGEQLLPTLLLFALILLQGGQGEQIL